MAVCWHIFVFVHAGLFVCYNCFLLLIVICGCCDLVGVYLCCYIGCFVAVVIVLRWFVLHLCWLLSLLLVWLISFLCLFVVCFLIVLIVLWCYLVRVVLLIFIFDFG